jgi:hypothetical protein
MIDTDRTAVATVATENNMSVNINAPIEPHLYEYTADNYESE